MRTSICLLAFLAIASVAMAVVGPVTSITSNNTGVSPNEVKILTGITVGANTFPMDKLRTGTSTSGANNYPNVSDLDMNTGNSVAYPCDTVSFGGKDFFSTNGSLPDFFLFEGAGTGTGNPDDVAITPIFPNGSFGTAVPLPTTVSTTGWGNVGTLRGSYQNGQAITGVCWDITDMKDAAGNFLSSSAVIKGIRITQVSGGIDIVMFCAAIPLALRGQAHTPVPTDMATLVDPATTTQVSWYSPEQDNLGAFKDDPNIVAVTGYKYWFGTVEPNEFTQTPTTTTSQNFNVSLAYKTTYKWRVDTLVTWDSTAVTGTINDTIKGYVWKFTTQSPTITFNGVVTTQAFLPASLSASVLGFANPITTATFSILTNDLEYPAGAIASVTSTTTNLQTPTATLTTDKPGKYKVKLVVTDGVDTVEKTVEVLVYAAADDCAARKAAGGWVAAYYDSSARPNNDDYDDDCIVNLGDFAELAKAWLNNTGLLAQQTYTGTASYLPQSIFDARIEAESVNAIDPNWVSAYPITDTTGVRVVPDTAAIGGGQVLGYTDATTFAQYTVNLTAGKYDLHLYTSTNVGTNVLSFGDAVTPALYGSVSGLPNAGFGNYAYTVHPGALTVAADATILRITWTGGARNLDWFTLVKQ